jgi:SAM-dependent methyltransferase
MTKELIPNPLTNGKHLNMVLSGEQPTIDFWETAYQTGKTGWDLGQPSPVLAAWADRPDVIPGGRMAVVGCGRGHDAVFLADRGFQVVGFDLAPSAIAEADQAARDRGVVAEFVQADILNLAAHWVGQFDWVIEHTCFCAIDPSLRPAYVQAVRSLLTDQGSLVAVFFAHDRPGGPPFGTSVAEIQQLFEPQFVIQELQRSAHSIDRRRDEEYLGWLRPRLASRSPVMSGESGPLV